jgi:hypothetical protein
MRVTLGLILVSLLVSIGCTFVATGAAYKTSQASSSEYSRYMSVERQYNSYGRIYLVLHNVHLCHLCTLVCHMTTIRLYDRPIIMIVMHH